MLWIYGDSFGEDHAGNPLQWFKQLGFDSVNNRCLAGASNEYIFDRVFLDRHLFEKDHTIIIILTQSQRQWFFEDRPDMGNYLNTLDLDLQIGKRRYSALESYIRHLYNPAAETARSHIHELAAQQLAQTLAVANTIIIPAFENLGHTSTRGNLDAVSRAEFVNIAVQKMWYAQGTDRRANHLSSENHLVLAQKIQHTLRTGEPLDLTRGFSEQLIRTA